ncbi:MAG: hypothetical protein IPI35_27135 [Deltaproteobacteria bacterium]|nr:hypothetical protein [Deltaproteobacteria bacterium]
MPFGTYDIAIQLGASDPRPNSLTTVRRDVDVSGDGGLDLNVQVGEIKLKVTYDGGKVPSASSGDDVLVLFTDTSTKETQSYSFDGGEDTVDVPYGTYDIAVQLGASDPRPNSLATVRTDVDISGDGGLDLNLQVGELKLKVTYDGGKVPSASSGDDVLVLFTETSTNGDTVLQLRWRRRQRGRAVWHLRRRPAVWRVRPSGQLPGHGAPRRGGER